MEALAAAWDILWIILLWCFWVLAVSIMLANRRAPGPWEVCDEQ